MRKFQWYTYTGSERNSFSGLLPHSKEPFTTQSTGTVYSVCPDASSVFIESGAHIPDESLSQIPCEKITSSVKHSDIRSLINDSDEIDVVKIGDTAIRTKDELDNISTNRTIQSVSIYLNSVKVVFSHPVREINIDSTDNQVCELICREIASYLHPTH